MSPLQLKVLDFVRDRLTNLGFAPTLDEIADHIQTGKTAAHRLVALLIDQGALCRTTAGTRALALPTRPDLRTVGSDALHAELARRGDTLEALSQGQRLAFGRVRTCATDGCGDRVEPGHLMCRPHWWALPHDLQVAIKDAHQVQDLPTYRRLVREARDLAATRRIG